MKLWTLPASDIEEWHEPAAGRSVNGFCCFAKAFGSGMHVAQQFNRGQTPLRILAQVYRRWGQVLPAVLFLTVKSKPQKQCMCPAPAAGGSVNGSASEP